MTTVQRLEEGDDAGNVHGRTETTEVMVMLEL